VLTLAAETTHHAPTVVVVFAGFFVALSVLVPTVFVLRESHRTRHALRCCPRCGGRAVREAKWGAGGILPSCVALQCGQCATWRRVLAADADRRAQRRRMRRDRSRIERQLHRLEAQRPCAHRRTLTIGGPSHSEQRRSP
jgi:hypothetical protein